MTKREPLSAAPQHQCFLYAGAPSSHLANIAETLKQRLIANHRCLYLNSPPMVAGMRWHLWSAGVNLTEVTERRDLALSSSQEHLRDGKFDADNMVRLLREALNTALTDGYKGLWAAGDMTWEFGSEDNLDKLMDYERRLEDLMQRNPALSGVCLYHRDTLPSHAIETALKTHPALYISAHLSEINPRYHVSHNS